MIKAVLFLLLGVLGVVRVNAACSGTAEYEVRLDAKWSKARHPQRYPGGQAHFSPIVVWAHTEDYSTNSLGSMASNGLEIVAETGGTSLMRSELGNANKVLGYKVGSGIGTGSGASSKVTLMVDCDHAYISAQSMIAPSPDWLVSVFSQKLTDSDGKWMQSVDVNSPPYDAGTDDGKFFTSGNANSSPAEPISEIGCGDVFCKSGTVKTVGTWEIRLKSTNGVDEGDQTPAFNCGKFRMRRRCNRRRRKGCRWQRRGRKCVMKS